MLLYLLLIVILCPWQSFKTGVVFVKVVVDPFLILKSVPVRVSPCSLSLHLSLSIYRLFC